MISKNQSKTLYNISKKLKNLIKKMLGKKGSKLFDLSNLKKDQELKN